MTSKNLQPLLTPTQVAEHLGVPITTLYGWKYKGYGPRTLRVGRHLRYRVEDVEAWVQQQKGQ